MSDVVSSAFDEVREQYHEGVQFLTRCTKPDAKEYSKIARAIAAGFLLIGGVGYAIQLIHIPIRKLIVGI